MKFETKDTQANHDYLAPDGSEIRLLPEFKDELNGINLGGLAHCILPPGKTTEAVKHRTVYEIWYIIRGKGEIWRKSDEQEEVVELIPDRAITIPVGTSFQFRNSGNEPLEILIVTMPTWPQPEAGKVKGIWE